MKTLRAAAVGNRPVGTALCERPSQHCPALVVGRDITVCLRSIQRTDRPNIIASRNGDKGADRQPRGYESELRIGIDLETSRHGDGGEQAGIDIAPNCHLNGVVRSDAVGDELPHAGCRDGQSWHRRLSCQGTHRVQQLGAELGLGGRAIQLFGGKRLNLREPLQRERLHLRQRSCRGQNKGRAERKKARNERMHEISSTCLLSAG